MRIIISASRLFLPEHHTGLMQQSHYVFSSSPALLSSRAMSYSRYEATINFSDSMKAWHIRARMKKRRSALPNYSSWKGHVTIVIEIFRRSFGWARHQQMVHISPLVTHREVIFFSMTLLMGVPASRWHMVYSVPSPQAPSITKSCLNVRRQITSQHISHSIDSSIGHCIPPSASPPYLSRNRLLFSTVWRLWFHISYCRERGGWHAPRCIFSMSAAHNYIDRMPAFTFNKAMVTIKIQLTHHDSKHDSSYRGAELHE